MKKILLLLIAIPAFAVAQIEVNHENIPKKEGRYGTYVTKSGTVISLKDLITIGLPNGPDGFRFITMGWEGANNVISGRKVSVKRIRTFKRNILRGKVFLEFNLNTLSPFRIDYEMALKSGEIEAPSVTE